MIIRKFEEQVEQFPHRIAVKDKNKFLTYAGLNRCANRAASEIIACDKTLENTKNLVVSLLFEHSSDVIVGIIAALKANKTYVPLDVNYPQKRMVYMLAHSESYIILTNSENHPLAENLVKQSARKIRVLLIDNIEDINDAILGNHLELKREIYAKQPAYILYTSGSTGKPKGVVQNHESVMYFIKHWTRRFSITEFDRITLLASLSHDGAIPDIFASLLNGAALYPYDIKKKPNINDLIEWLHQEKITIWHSVPTFYRYFTSALNGEELFPHLRLIVLGGEEVRTDDIMRFKTYFPASKFANIYGQTESTVNSIWVLSQQDSFKKVIIGEPIGDSEIFLVDEEGGVVEEMGMGEIVIASDHVATGYWKDKENSEKVFPTHRELGRLYWTGDLGRLNPDGSITISGRKDFQVKIRGFRVETGEIESVLLKYPAVKEAVTIVKVDENGDNYLCAYIVANTSILSAELRELISAELPDYMIPKYFINIEKMPLTVSGKIDRNALPEPDSEPQIVSKYEPPTNHIEKELITIWQEVLGVEGIEINSNFFDLGGHSLIIMTKLSKIHRMFNVELQIKDVFDNPTIKELSQLIMRSKRTIASSIEPVEEKEYYEATSDQKRIFILNEFEEVSTTYNQPNIGEIEGKPDKNRFQKIFQALIKRHDALRTSFQLRDGEIVQEIHQDVDFQMMYIDAGEENHQDEGDVQKIIKEFIKPFDLNQTPLIRLGLVKLSQDKHLMLLDIHHIIADGVSVSLFMSEFVRLYSGKELPQLKVRYIDYSEWNNQLLHSGQLKPQEEYWLNTFNGEIPILNWPIKYPRPPVQGFEGDTVWFHLGKEINQTLNQLMKETQTTLFMVLLAMYNVLLNKYTGQEDIVIGTVVSGRNEVELEHIIGFFVKTLALRNYPAGNKTFDLFLEEVKGSTLKAFENQMYPFEQLVKKLNLIKNRSRNPLFDTAFFLQNTEIALPEKTGLDKELKSTFFGYESKSSKFDLTFEAYETKDGIACCFQYCTKIFKRKTIELMKERFLIIIENILNNRQTEIQNLDYTIPIEKKISKVQAQKIDFNF